MRLIPSIDDHNHYNKQMLSLVHQHCVFEPVNNNNNNNNIMIVIINLSVATVSLLAFGAFQEITFGTTDLSKLSISYGFLCHLIS